MPDDGEKEGLIFIPRDGGELADVLRGFTGSSNVESVRTDREDVAADVVAGIKRKDEMIESFRTGTGNRFKQLLDRIFSLPAMTEASNAENCDGDCANCKLHNDVGVGQRSHEAKESQTPGWRKFALKIPFNPTWSRDFVHASELFLPICTIIAEDCKADLIEGENIVAVNNFRVQDVMESNSVDIHIGFSADVPRELEELGKPTFLMSLRTDKGRDISVRGYRKECDGKRILNPLGGWLIYFMDMSQ